MALPIEAANVVPSNGFERAPRGQETERGYSISSLPRLKLLKGLMRVLCQAQTVRHATLCVCEGVVLSFTPFLWRQVRPPLPSGDGGLRVKSSDPRLCDGVESPVKLRVSGKVHAALLLVRESTVESGCLIPPIGSFFGRGPFLSFMLETPFTLSINGLLSSQVLLSDTSSFVRYRRSSPDVLTRH